MQEDDQRDNPDKDIGDGKLSVLGVPSELVDTG